MEKVLHSDSQSDIISVVSLPYEDIEYLLEKAEDNISAIVILIDNTTQYDKLVYDKLMLRKSELSKITVCCIFDSILTKIQSRI